MSFSLVSCAGSLKPFYTQKPVAGGIKSAVGQSLKNIPKPENKIVAAVYRFRDETGQYKPSETISYSTAVTQGATSILIQAMGNSGWFTPIERTGISNLLNERRIIQSTRKNNHDNTKLHPLLFAGILMEGGIIGYDSNVLTGGAGVRYFGTGVSGQFRKDRVTIYLRAVSTKSGRILKSVRVTKSIISQELSGGLFRYVDANRLLEAEIGVTMNEPPTIAVTAAIDAAVRRLIVKGAEEGLWQPKNKEAFKSYKLALNKQHKEEKMDYYGLVHRPELRSGFAITTNYSFGSYIGSYGNETQNSGVMVQLEQFLIPSVSLKLNYQRTQIGSKQVFSAPVNDADLMVTDYLMPHLKFSPYVSAGGGVLAYDKKPNFTKGQFYPTLSGEAGIDYRFSKTVGLRIGVNYRYLIDTGLDGMSVGRIHDQQWNIITGISFYL